MHLVVILRQAFADWEMGILAASVTEFMGGTVGYHSPEAPEITSLGGLTARVAPMGDVPRDAPLALCGSTRWFEDDGGIAPLVNARIAAGIPVGGICAGSFALAQTGVLDGRDHTGNSAGELAKSGYAGASRFRSEPAVTDRGVVTAPATAPGQFAAAMLTLIAPEHPALPGIRDMVAALR